jgi:hypothetical protein
MIILRSTGPVISTRRHSRSAGSGATFQSPSRIAFVSAGSRALAGVEALRALDARLQQFLATRLEGAVQLRDEGERFGREDRFVARRSRR